MLLERCYVVVLQYTKVHKYSIIVYNSIIVDYIASFQEPFFYPILRKSFFWSSGEV